jgi:hypothetical protein
MLFFIFYYCRQKFGFEISVKFYVFDTHIKLWREKNGGPISALCELGSQKAHEGARKNRRTAFVSVS